MWARTARFDSAIVQSHTVAFKAQLWSPGLTDLLVDDLTMVSGTVTADRTAQYRRSATVNVLDVTGELAPLFKSQTTVLPYELTVSRGILYPEGDSELIPLGVFPVSSVQINQGGNLTIGAFDRARKVSRNKFSSPYVVNPGTRYIDAAAALVDNRLPYGIPVERTSESVRTDTNPYPIVFMEQDDPWDKTVGLVTTIGAETFFDRLGRHVIRDEPDTTAGNTPIDFAYIDGETSIILPETVRTISDDPGYNAVLVTGENSDNTVGIPRYLAFDNDPGSPTYWFGSYGAVTEYYNDTTVTNNNQAQVVANARLRRWLGRNDVITLTAVPHPAHDPSDVLLVDYGGSEQLMLIESVTIPLDVTSAASITCRAQMQAP